MKEEDEQNNELDSKEAFRKVETALYHIHSMADVLDEICTNADLEIATKGNETSNIFLSLAQIIKEKSEFCLLTIDEQGVV